MTTISAFAPAMVCSPLSAKPLAANAPDAPVVRAESTRRPPEATASTPVSAAVTAAAASSAVAPAASATETPLTVSADAAPGAA